MFKKAVPDKITDIFSMYYMKDMEMVKIFSNYCFFSVRIGHFLLILVDHKTYFWTKGVVNSLVEVLLKAMNEESQDETLIENITLALYNLSLDNCENYF